MTMHPLHYRDLVVRAVTEKDDTMLGAIANQLLDCENAKGILRRKGYGQHGMTTSAAAELVPQDPRREFDGLPEAVAFEAIRAFQRTVDPNSD